MKTHGKPIQDKKRHLLEEDMDEMGRGRSGMRTTGLDMDGDLESDRDNSAPFIRKIRAYFRSLKRK